MLRSRDNLMQLIGSNQLRIRCHGDRTRILTVNGMYDLSQTEEGANVFFRHSRRFAKFLFPRGSILTVVIDSGGSIIIAGYRVSMSEVPLTFWTCDDQSCNFNSLYCLQSFSCLLQEYPVCAFNHAVALMRVSWGKLHLYPEFGSHQPNGFRQTGCVLVGLEKTRGAFRLCQSVSAQLRQKLNEVSDRHCIVVVREYFLRLGTDEVSHLGVTLVTGFNSHVQSIEAVDFTG
mmetsp:Transcript_8496/g.34958  ORF Transcript_8496/g.34958 Transcript_8496/m.34958 type:complete len:231 (+) Transcript_8496:246-938(+)